MKRTPMPILWMDRLLHQVKTTGNHCWLVFTLGHRILPGFLRWCEMDFATIHSMAPRTARLLGSAPHPAPPPKAPPRGRSGAGSSFGGPGRGEVAKIRLCDGLFGGWLMGFLLDLVGSWWVADWILLVLVGAWWWWLMCVLCLLI